MSGMATAWMPESTMLMAMMPGNSRVLYSGRMMPPVVMTRPKMKTNRSGCKRFCSSMGNRLRRATWPSRESMA